MGAGTAGAVGGGKRLYGWGGGYGYGLERLAMGTEKGSSRGALWLRARAWGGVGYRASAVATSRTIDASAATAIATLPSALSA